MNRYIPIGIALGYPLAIVGAVTFIAACTPAQIQQAQTDISAGITAACKDVMAANALNPSSPVAPWAVGACGTASQVAALVQSSGTLQWLGSLQAQLAAPTAAAPAASAS